MTTRNVSTAEVMAQSAGLEVRSKKQVQEWLVTMVAELLEMKPEEIDAKASFERYGLDSSAAIGMTDSLGAWIGCELDPALLYDYPTIEAVSEHLVAIGKVNA